MTERVLVTGGAGFIGSHLVDRLISRGLPVRVLDSLEPQVHGRTVGYRNPEAEYVEATILDRDRLASALKGVDAVIHLAAQVGIGQSMYEISRYVRENSLGAAMLLESLAQKRDVVSTLIVASSMSIYGEGQYLCPACGSTDSEVVRTPAALQARRWEPVCTRCGLEARPIPTQESKRLRCDSIYAVTKRDHEELGLVFGRAYGIRTIALRFFNVYGTRQSLLNPYTGVAAIFCSRLLNGQAPLIFEDGLQSRDFVHVSDVVRAIELALAAEGVGDIAINVGTGVPTTVRQVADVLGEELGVGCKPRVVKRFRHGDVRHCFADLSTARRVLGFEPEVTLRRGMKDLVAWIGEALPPIQDSVALSTRELEVRGLVV
jgi:dTDP-L-rhamnose 4-epimerase